MFQLNKMPSKHFPATHSALVLSPFFPFNNLTLKSLGWRCFHGTNCYPSLHKASPFPHPATSEGKGGSLLRVHVICWKGPATQSPFSLFPLPLCQVSNIIAAWLVSDSSCLSAPSQASGKHQSCTAHLGFLYRDWDDCLPMWFSLLFGTVLLFPSFIFWAGISLHGKVSSFK